jgi:hypothetical protein
MQNRSAQFLGAPPTIGDQALKHSRSEAALEKFVIVYCALGAMA